MKEIIAKNEYYLTQISEVVDGRIFATMIKGENVNEKEWKEITIEEKEIFEQTHFFNYNE